jgi:hypothetical protein
MDEKFDTWLEGYILKHKNLNKQISAKEIFKLAKDAWEESKRQLKEEIEEGMVS